jgi:hypothetical protein
MPLSNSTLIDASSCTCSNACSKPAIMFRGCELRLLDALIPMEKTPSPSSYNSTGETAAFAPANTPVATFARAIDGLAAEGCWVFAADVAADETLGAARAMAGVLRSPGGRIACEGGSSAISLRTG